MANTQHYILFVRHESLTCAQVFASETDFEIASPEDDSIQWRFQIFLRKFICQEQEIDSTSLTLENSCDLIPFARGDSEIIKHSIESQNFCETESASAFLILYLTLFR